MKGVSNGNIYMVPKCLKGIINAHIQRSKMYAGYTSDFGARASTYFLRLMTLYLPCCLLLRDTVFFSSCREKEAGWINKEGGNKDKCKAYGDQIFNYTQGYDDSLILCQSKQTIVL